MLDMFSLKGKKAIVTGGSSGLGKGIKQAYIEAGAKVAVIHVNKNIETIESEISAVCYDIHANLGNRDELREAFEKAVGLLGGLDILVNCAGIQRRNKCEDFTIEDWDQVIEINLTSVFELCQMAGRIMINQGSGKIINIASLLSFFGGYTIPAYAASKGGIAQLTKALTNEWAQKGVNINALAPGYMDTNMNTALISDEARNRQILDRIPAGRWGTADDVKGIAVFLASEASAYINGAIIPVDGGYLGR